MAGRHLVRRPDRNLAPAAAVCLGGCAAPESLTGGPMLRLLKPVEATQFREDFRQKEQEIQKNIGIYLSALVVATGWIVGPQARPLDELFLGNEGRNLYGIFVI